MMRMQMGRRRRFVFRLRRFLPAGAIGCIAESSPDQTSKLGGNLLVPASFRRLPALRHPRCRRRRAESERLQTTNKEEGERRAI